MQENPRETKWPQGTRKKQVQIGNDNKNLWMAPIKAIFLITAFDIFFMNGPKPKYLCMTSNQKVYG